MKYYGKIQDPKDLITKEYADTKQAKNDSGLNTTAKTVVGAINEHESDISQLSSAKVDKSAQASKTASMTQAVGIDADGKLWSVPGGGGGGSVDYFTVVNGELCIVYEEANNA